MDKEVDMINGAVQLFNRTLSGFSPFQIVAGTLSLGLTYKLSTVDWAQFKADTQRTLYYYLNRTPYVRDIVKAEIDKQVDKELDKIDASVHKNRTVRFTELPDEPIQRETLISIVKNICDFEKLGDQVSGAIYRSNEHELSEFAGKIFELSAYTNPLHPGLWDDIKQCENEVVQMCAKLMHCDSGFIGSINHGGTTSILEAVRTYRDWAKDTKNITKPNIIVAKNRHVAFDKAGDYFGVKVIEVDINPQTGQMDIEQLKKKINHNTIMILGSAPSYPHGIMDDIEALSKIALKYNCGLHVDACLGGFVAPFLQEAGFELPAFDFALKGVTSMSMDTHKQGNVPKGSSVLVFRKEQGEYEADFYPGWMGGLYLTPGMDGSRSGAMILLTWAIMASIGRSGYVEQAKGIRTLLDNVKLALAELPEIRVIGNPQVNVVAFQFIDPQYNIYLLSEKMKEKGWHLNGLQHPAAVHICLTAKQTEKPDYIVRLISDLKESIEYIKKHPAEKPKGDGATYGALQEVPKAIAPQLLDLIGRKYNSLDSNVEVTREGAKKLLGRT